MSRRANHARNLPDTWGEPEPSIAPGPRTVRAPISEREAKLRQFKSHSVGRVSAVLQDQIIDLMLATPQWSGDSDRFYLGWLTRYAVWVSRMEGRFDPALHMDDDRIQTWAEQDLTQCSEASKHTAWLAVRRVRDRDPSGRRRTQHPHAAAPYTDMEWRGFERAAASLGDLNRWAVPVRMLLDLTGHAGLRANELTRAEGTWVSVNGQWGVALTVPNRDGQLRIVPVTGAAAKRLAVHAGKPGLLLAPRHTGRRANTVNHIVKNVRIQSPGLAGFRVIAARHMWLAKLMQLPIPFADVATIADINPGSSAVTELLRFLPDRDPESSSEATFRIFMKGYRA